jgi:RES domain
MSAAFPGLHPQPPNDLSKRKLPTIFHDKPLWRVCKIEHSPIYFGCSGNNRFDAPTKEYEILYAGCDEFCAFRETIGRLTQQKIITKKLLQSRYLSKLRASLPLKLIDLTGGGLTHIDADARLLTGDYTIAQQWSLAFWQHPETIDGIYYRSRYDPSRFCIGLYDRAQNKLEISFTKSFLDDRSRLAEILEIYQYGYIE